MPNTKTFAEAAERKAISRVQQGIEYEANMDNDTEWIDVGEDDRDAALRYALVIEWSPEDDAFVVSVPDIPGLHAHGSTREEAATMGNDAVALWIAGDRETGVATPPPRFSVLHEEPLHYTTRTL
jgi:predicted RNase H-like HicB family nuclease